jgi:hypothetical protein
MKSSDDQILKLRRMYEATTYSENEQEAAKLFLNRLKQAEAKTLLAIGFVIIDQLASNVSE